MNYSLVHDARAAMSGNGLEHEKYVIAGSLLRTSMTFLRCCHDFIDKVA